MNDRSFIDTNIFVYAAGAHDEEKARISDRLIGPLTVNRTGVISFQVVHEFLNVALSWYDSLLIAAAAEAGCSTLYTEDMQHGAVIRGVKIVNPFLTN